MERNLVIYNEKIVFIVKELERTLCLEEDLGRWTFNTDLDIEEMFSSVPNGLFKTFYQTQITVFPKYLSSLETIKRWLVGEKETLFGSKIFPGVVIGFDEETIVFNTEGRTQNESPNVYLPMKIMFLVFCPMEGELIRGQIVIQTERELSLRVFNFFEGVIKSSEIENGEWVDEAWVVDGNCLEEGRFVLFRVLGTKQDETFLIEGTFKEKD